MKNAHLILFAFFLVFSCFTVKAQETPNKPKMMSNEAKKDCKSSGGYQWSRLKNECIRPFKEGIKLTSIQSSKSASYILMDKSDVELFSAEFPHPIIFQKQNAGNWKKGNWEIEYKNDKYGLKKEGILLYQN